MKLVVFLFACLWVDWAVAGAMDFEKAWARATPPGAGTAAVYGTLRNNSDHPIELVSVSSKWAAMAMVHRSETVDGMMRMHHVEGLKLDPQSQQDFVPGGLHIMLMGLTRAMKPGDRMPLTLQLKSGEAVTIEVSVGKISQMAYPEN